MATVPIQDHPDLGPDPIGARIRTAYRSDRLLYRGVDADDIELLYRIRAEPEVEMNARIGWPNPCNRDDAKTMVPIMQGNYLSAIMELDLEREQPGLVDELKRPPPWLPSSSQQPSAQSSAGATPTPTTTTKVPIGEISLYSPFGARQFRTAELAVNILPAYHGRGYGTEAIRWILDWAFEMAGLHRVRLCCMSYNTKAIRVYEKIGFERCGVEKESLWLAGRYWDFITYGILDREWLALKEERKAKGLRV